jgi:hypothetical protein
MLKENFPPEAPHVKWALASPAAREKTERGAIIANIMRQNHKKIAEERGTPFDTFHRIWKSTPKPASTKVLTIHSHIYVHTHPHMTPPSSPLVVCHGVGRCFFPPR